MKENWLYMVTFGLIILWILLTILKKTSINPIIQRNAVGVWLLLFIGLTLSKYFC